MTQLTTITWLKFFLKRVKSPFNPYSAKCTTTFLRLTVLMFCLFTQILLIAQPANKKRATERRKTAEKVISQKDSLQKKEVQLIYSTAASHLTATSTDVVYNKDITNVPVTNVGNSLSGRLSGLFTQQFSGQPFSDGVSLKLHGRSPIVMIDGVVRNLTTIDMGEIESVTLLKDAVSTAMLGSRGANGVLLITTKKGAVGKQSISFTAQTAFQQALSLPKTLHSYDYAILRNEAIDNDLRVRPDLFSSLNPLRYSAADIQSFKDTTDPFGHPDVDWQAQLFKKTAQLSRYSLNISGGNTWSRYFVSLENISQGGFLNQNGANKYSTDSWGKSYIARTNVELNITPKLTGSIGLFGRVVNNNQPGTGIASIYSGILNTPNNAYPVYNRDSSFAGNQTYQNNLQEQATGSGYLQSYSRDILTDFNLKRTLDEITPGLWVKAKFAYASNLIENYTRSKPVVVYNATSQTTYQQYGVKASQFNGSSISAQGRQNYIELSAGYSHTFNNIHGIDVLLLANRDNSVNGSDLPYTVSGTSGKISYNYKEKYILEAAFGLNGSNRYNVDSVGGSTLYGFFPSIGAAWNITNENFAKNITWLSYLKLYASYGKSGWDNPGYFSYIQTYTNLSQAYFGTSAGGFNSLGQPSLANSNVTTEKANKFNVGIQGSLFKNKLSLTAEYFNNKFSDLLIQRGQNTGLLGITYPNENIGQNRYSGMDFQLSWNTSVNKDFKYFIAANVSTLTTKVLYMDEATRDYPWMVRTGNKVERSFGYVADGLFQSAADVLGKATLAGYIAQPGDIKYKDLNNDGVINQLDQAAIGTNKPLLIYGVNLGFTFKSFDFSALIQGVGNQDRYLSGSGIFEFQNSGTAQAYQNNLDRWTPSNPNGKYPRLGIAYTSNNQAFSSFWMRSGDYLRLKNLEIGYSLPAKLASKAKMSSVRIFANGLNLLTTTSVAGVDPEVYGVYPIQRLFNFGINIKL